MTPFLQGPPSDFGPPGVLDGVQWGAPSSCVVVLGVFTAYLCILKVFSGWERSLLDLPSPPPPPLDDVLTWPTQAAVVIGVAAHLCAVFCAEALAVAQRFEPGRELQVAPAVHLTHKILWRDVMSTKTQLSARHHDALAGYPSFGLHSLHQGVQRSLFESFQKSMSSAREFLLQSRMPRCALIRAPSVFSWGPIRAPRSDIPFPKQTTRHRPTVALLSQPRASVLRDAHGTSVIVRLLLFLPLHALRQVSSLPCESRSWVSVCHRPLLMSVELS